mmetsp:Transcript_14951/g.56771  ORF Transcript_14951/g.56771 Transcript_14951/m.56771 type:complete len:222 (-) Transcript_14951:2-667(-)
MREILRQDCQRARGRRKSRAREPPKAPTTPRCRRRCRRAPSQIRGPWSKTSNSTWTWTRAPSLPVSTRPARRTRAWRQRAAYSTSRSIHRKSSPRIKRRKRLPARRPGPVLRRERSFPSHLQAPGESKLDEGARRSVRRRRAQFKATFLRALSSWMLCCRRLRASGRFPKRIWPTSTQSGSSSDSTSWLMERQTGCPHLWLRCECCFPSLPTTSPCAYPAW